MSNILSGLEKFGLNAKDVSVFEEEKKEEETTQVQGKDAIKEPEETEFLLEKGVRCVACDQVFKTKVIKSGRVRRLEPDEDLRPRHQYIDTLKYGITACPHCGYAAMSANFDTLTSTQAKLIKEAISSRFQGGMKAEPEIYTYEEALDRYKLALFNTIVKKGKASEKAFICLKMSWLLRGKCETLPQSTTVEKVIYDECHKEELEFYQEAYDGFLMASSTENYPMCGMEQSTVDFLIAYMAFKLGKLDVASRFVSGILTSQNTNRKMKDKALDLKNEIIHVIKNRSNN
ncbi:MAG: DUF2225 domain-containing protein [Lachnospiraceae bacterium]|nr:DUF2225 domain-containing protein [Lachnospiraceae bacterium]